jgi:hypothetical protein
MKLALIFLLIGMSAAGVFAQKSGRFVSSDGSFSVTLPAGFDNFVDKATPPAAGVTPTGAEHKYGQEITRGNVSLYVYIIPESLRGRTPEQAFEVLRSSTAKGGWTVDKDEIMTFGTMPGLSITTQKAVNGTSIYGRTVNVVTKDRSYILMFLTKDRAELDKPDIKGLFESFRILK